MVSKKIVLHFSEGISNQPVVYRLVKDYDLEFNILKANIDYKKEGILILELKGKGKDYSNGIKYLEDAGIKIQPLSQDIVKDDKRCIDCGVCIPMCPSHALVFDDSGKVVFHDSRCIACEMCTKACPQKAMELFF
jgi:ferredoxin